MSDYRPGHCNIGRRERRKRALVAAGAFLAAALYTVACVVGLLPEALLVAVFLPLGVGFEWGLQAYDAFCVRLAVLGRYSVDDETGTVEDSENRHADQLEATKITAAAIVLAALVTAGIVLAV